jgi:hypothetical protein
MSDREEPGSDERRGAEQWLAPFFRDSSLWPVLAVAGAIFVVMGTSGLLLAFVERNGFAVAAVLLVFWMSVDAVIRNRRRHGSALVPGCIAALWGLSAAAACAVWAAGWF